MSTPVRLDDQLVKQAAAEAGLQHRTTPRQIEFWASIGQAVAGQLSAEDLVALTQGLKEVHLERPSVEMPATDDIWADVEAARETGSLSESIRQDRVVYQASMEHPGYLEAIEPDGTRTLGIFRNGRFRKSDDRDAA
ncbi:ParD-like antitoxin of type II ParDE toxin-antitoxin system [Halospina denitrificans]|uniref:ParD-like antitoxin of type II ParDE toxin-antitoxin system n=1 Tax=Halospina denitrificans TaxID=332522 RepID=A0A4R7JTY8_9GAMM|nr:hypothetical protein [Halospina denitrificans]TDT40369.1 ParD-like antitoxin of type II ParDE toxin-antitoxin system [Halospina denitrificans]